MDIISFNEASTANGRIESFIENPDSTSGVLTVPKTIAAGETITIPAGRVAILPDLQVDGDLVVDGDLFIPTGSMTSQVVQKVTSTDNAVVRFNGTTGDVQNSGVIIDDSGNIGIGISNPVAELHIKGTSTPTYSRIKLSNSTSGDSSTDGFDTVLTGLDAYLINRETGGNLILSTSGVERLRIDSTGNVGIGVTPKTYSNSGSNIELLGGRVLSWQQDSNLCTNAYYNSGWKYRVSGILAANYAQNAGSHTWYTSSGTVTADAAINGTGSFTTAMTLDASGNLLVGTTATTAATNGFFIRDNGTLVNVGHPSGTVSGSGYVLFGYNGTQIGSITQSGTTAVAYNTTSDYRLKENVRPADCKKFMDIKFVDYERIDGRHECGVIAHELQEVYPDLVTGEKDATEIRKVEISPAVEEVKDEDGNIIVEAVEATYEEQEFPVYQQVNYMGLIARIGTVVQQQAKLIEAMQLEINELKGAK